MTAQYLCSSSDEYENKDGIGETGYNWPHANLDKMESKNIELQFTLVIPVQTAMMRR